MSKKIPSDLAEVTIIILVVIVCFIIAAIRISNYDKMHEQKKVDYFHCDTTYMLDGNDTTLHVECKKKYEFIYVKKEFDHANTKQ